MEKCLVCGKLSVHLVEDFSFHGHTLRGITVDVCDECGEVFYSLEAAEMVSNIKREERGILFPDEMRGKRRKFGLTQEQIADELMIQRVTYVRWEKGSRVPTTAQNQRLNDLFERYEEQLVRDEFATEYLNILSSSSKAENVYALAAHSSTNFLTDPQKKIRAIIAEQK